MNDRIVAEKREKLETSLFNELLFRNIVLPNNLVKVTAAILSKIFAENSSYEMLEIIGFGSIWAWALDEITDNANLNLDAKKDFLKNYIHLFDTVDFNKKISLEKFPETSSLIIDCFNKIIEYSNLNDLDRRLLKEEYVDCLKGFEYESINMGILVPIEDSLYQRSYSYVPPFYGAMVYAADFHVKNEGDYQAIRPLLRVFGEITRIHNDIGTYYKEKASGEINLIWLLIKSGLNETEAFEKAKEYLARATQKFNELSKPIEEKRFLEVLNKFIDVHGKMYSINNVRIIDPTTI